MAENQMQALLASAMAKTKIIITGIVKQVEIKPAANGKNYGTLFLDVSGVTDGIKIKLGENPTITQYQLFDLVSIDCIIKRSFDGRSQELCAK